MSLPPAASANAVATVALSARALHLAHPGATREAVRDLHLDLIRGEILAIVGPNGSGKSTLLSALARDLRPVSGEVITATVDGRRAGTARGRFDRKAFARAVARLPQEPSCPGSLTVEELVTSGRHPHRPAFVGTDAADRAAVREALAWTDLEHARTREVAKLSGGERRRAWLAMVLAQESDTLLLDEPLAGLDLGHRFEVADLLQRLARERRRTLAIVLHELPEAVRIADRVAVVDRGRLYACGTAAAVLTEETLRDVFGLEGSIEATPQGPRLTVTAAARERRFF
jgi:iron complex transport system ATP-binding protein